MIHTQQTNDEQNRFDRLVDGELSPDDYRALLSALDDEPGGWRECALAFLAAQALKQDLAVDDRANPLAPAAAAFSGVDASPARVRRLRPWVLMLTAAASFLIAFGLGVILSDVLKQSQTGPQREMFVETDDRPLLTPRDAPGEGAGTALAHDRKSPQRDALQTPDEADVLPVQAHQPIGNVTLLVEDDQANRRSVEIPIFDSEQIGDDFWTRDHSAISPELVELIRLSGHRIQREQAYVPLTLSDGQQVVVPVEEIEITPVSLPPF